MAKKKKVQGRPKKAKAELRKPFTLYLSDGELADVQAAVPFTDASSPRAWGRSVVTKAARQILKKAEAERSGK